MSNIKNFKYDWIWNKKLAGNGILAKKQPLKIHEIVSVFNTSVYYPQMVKGKFRRKMTGELKESEITGGNTIVSEYKNDLYYPQSIQEFSIANMRKGRLHPTQKPVDLLEYLIKTYTNEGETVLDNAAGSMSTVIACINTNRNCIAIEKDDHYYSVGCKRVHDHILENNIDLCYNQVCGGVCLWQSSKTEQVKDMVGFRTLWERPPRKTFMEMCLRLWK